VLNVSAFRQQEVIFVFEYCQAVQPLAAALDILQSEAKCFLGPLGICCQHWFSGAPRYSVIWTLCKSFVFSTNLRARV